MLQDESDTCHFPTVTTSYMALPGHRRLGNEGEQMECSPSTTVFATVSSDNNMKAAMGLEKRQSAVGGLKVVEATTKVIWCGGREEWYRMILG